MATYEKLRNWVRIPTHYYMEEKKLKHGTKEYWKDWYWNRGGREKIQAKRHAATVERYRKQMQRDRSTMVVQSGPNPD